MTVLQIYPSKNDQFCRLDETGKQLMRSAMQQLAITARAFHLILNLGRTIADPSTTLRASLAGVEQIQAAHLAEAIQYRPRR
ncbi:MAG: hypothetical protein JXA42_14460 [Anaerolineales bacterium]|nr:hypothetical protein [Anaerolineales bacterium]